MVGHLGAVVDASYRNPWGSLEVLSTRKLPAFPMPFLHQYYTHYFVNSAGEPRPKNNLEVEQFLRERFANHEESLDTESNRHIQVELFNIFRNSNEDRDRKMAESSLRCYISFAIKSACQHSNIRKHISKCNQLHGCELSENDIYCRLLETESDFRNRQRDLDQSKSLSQGIPLKTLEKFDPKVGRDLQNYVGIKTKYAIFDHLEKHYNYVVKSRYTILSRHLTPSGLSKILHKSSVTEEHREELICFLKSFKNHYKSCKKPGRKLIAIPDKLKQLIFADLKNQGIVKLDANDLESMAQEIENYWREYKVNQLGGTFKLEYIDEGKSKYQYESINQTGVSNDESMIDNPDPINGWIDQFITETIQEVIPQKTPVTQKKKMAFWKALCLYCCHEKTQQEISKILGYSDVSKLLKFSHICEDISLGLVERIVRPYKDRQTSWNSDALIKLKKLVDRAIGDPGIRSFTPKSKRLSRCRLFDEICQYIQNIYPDLCGNESQLNDGKY